LSYSYVYVSVLYYIGTCGLNCIRKFHFSSWFFMLLYNIDDWWKYKNILLLFKIDNVFLQVYDRTKLEGNVWHLNYLWVYRPFTKRP